MSVPDRSSMSFNEEPDLLPRAADAGVMGDDSAVADASAAESSPAVVARPITQRIPMFDAMRVIAGFSVVFMHTPQVGPWERIARAQRFGVALFVTAAIILLWRSLQRRPEQTFGEYAVRRCQRLGVPLILWSLIYAAFYWANQRFLGGRNDVDFGLGFLLGGAAIHLWFLPFLLVVCILAFPLLKFAARYPDMRYWLCAVLVLCAVASLFLPFKFPGYDRGVRIFLEQSLWSVPTALAGLAIAMVLPKRIPESATPFIFAIGGAVYLAACYAAYRGISTPVIQAFKAIAVTSIALAPWSPRIVQKLAVFGTLSFGVYLVHLLFVTTLRELGRHAGISPAQIWFYPAVTVVAFGLSYACAITARKTRWGKLLFP